MIRLVARPWFAPVALAVVALALRVAYFEQVRSSPFFDNPIYDARDYLHWAQEIAAGNLVWDEPRLYPPGYPYFLALLIRVTGENLAAMTFANSLLGCAWIVLLVLALRRLLPRPTAEVTGLLAATYWMFFHFEAHLLSETLFIFLAVLALFLLTRGRPGARPAWAVITAGLVLGLATVTRPNAVASLPFVAWWLVMERPAARRLEAWKYVLPMLAAFAVVVSPVVVRTHQLTGLWSLRHHMSLNVYVGNRAGAPGYHTFRPGRDWDRLSSRPERAAGARSLGDHEQYFRDEVTRFLRDDPLEFAALQLRKLGLFFNHHEIRVILSPYFFDRYAPLQAAPFLPGFGWIGPLALVGLFLALAQRRGAALLYAFAVPQMLAVVLTVVGSRYRLPVVPFLLPFAGYTVVRIVSWVRAGAGRSAAAALVALAAAAVFVNRELPHERDENFAEEMERVAFVADERGDLDEATVWWERSLREDPSRIETYLGYARFAVATGDLARAEGVTRAGLAAGPGDPDLLRVRGRMFLLAGAADSAAVNLRAGLVGESAEDAGAWADLGRALSDLQRPDEALESFRRSLALDGRETGVLLDAALVMDETGRARGDRVLVDGARQLLERVLEIDPANAEARARLDLPGGP